MPQLAAFPKAWLDDLCVHGTMNVRQWLELGRTLGVDGFEFYSGFLELQDPANWAAVRRMVDDVGQRVPMFCCSPDFTHPDPAFRRRQVDAEKRWIDLSAVLGAGYCRVLSGQRRPEVGREEGIGYTVQCIEACLPHARQRGVTLIIENHYKDGYWQHPEFAQK